MAMVSLSKSAFENLVQHLVSIEEGKDNIVNMYFSHPSKEREYFKNILVEYINKLDQLVKQVKIAETSVNSLPFVIIGSEVEVQDLDNQETFVFRLVGPTQGSTCEGDVSYLSPVGKSLLLKNKGDEVTVRAPGGLFHYKITSIRMQETFHETLA